jgi:hypothetical protein
VRILCDHSVDARFVDTFHRTDWITMTTVADELSPDADDPDISKHAEQHDWIVFTEDEHFREYDHDRGLVLYTHLERPSPGDVIAALGNIADAYTDHRKINENVPEGWI